MWLLRYDGTLESTTTDSKGAGPVHWWTQVKEGLDPHDYCELSLNRPPLWIRAWRMPSPSEQESRRVAVLVREVPPWVGEAKITPRQREVSEYAAHGATVKEIAHHLGISLHTVRSHLKAVYATLCVANRVELAAALRATSPRPIVVTPARIQT